MQKKNRARTFLHICLTLFIGLILSLHVWIADILLIQYTNWSKDAAISFIPSWQLFFSSWRYGLLFQGPKGELALFIGYTQLLVIILIIITSFKKRAMQINKKHVLFWIIIFLLLLFLMFPISAIVWKIIPLLSLAQFSTRLLLPTAICASILAGYLSLLFPKRKFAITLLTIITIGYTILNWGHRRIIPEINDNSLIAGLPKSTYHYEALAFSSTKWKNQNDPWEKSVPKNHLDVLQGDAEIKNVKRIPTEHTYVIDAKSHVALKENTLYFPGWKVFANGSQKTIIYQNPSYPGIITFNLPQGLYFVDVVYQDLLLHRVAKYILLLLLSIIILYTTFFGINRKLTPEYKKS